MDLHTVNTWNWPASESFLLFHYLETSPSRLSCNGLPAETIGCVRSATMFTNRDSATITHLVISWSFGFTLQSPAWWSPGPLGSHYNHPPGDLLVLWVHTTITRLVISWSLGSHYNHPPGDLLVLWVHTKWNRTIVDLKLNQGWRVGMFLRGESHHFCLPQQHLSGSYIHDKTHVTILCPFYLFNPDQWYGSYLYAWRYFRTFLHWKRSCHLRAWFRLRWCHID